jgi:pyruvate formate lyase activating enzyme
MQLAGLLKFDLIDYPGEVSATVFTRGCNFRCFFCHNPELVVPEKYNPLLDSNEVLDFLAGRFGKLTGVCITGGEPLLQPDITDFIKKLKDMGYKVKLDTNGLLSTILEKVIQTKTVDYLAMDIKGNSGVYQAVSATSNLEALMASVKKSIELIKNSDVPYEFRTTIVKSFHKLEDFYEVGELIRGAKKYALQNYEHSKHVGDTTGVESFTRQELETFKVLMQEFVDEVAIRG